ncbi:MAG TPA: pantoate--beta-alanine ligase [Bryobacteraceae bacterium]|nr:pantoate--beta-alanine ligase [Bryobacteraceae bacterium]
MTAAPAQIIACIADLRRLLDQVRGRGGTIGLVPTMGALHEGHGKLIETAAHETSCVVVSIFVNPLQFDRRDDFERYPRPISKDIAFCTARGVSVVFTPAAEQMYPREERAFVDVARVADHLCGKFRPGHFRGVATVVLKLLNIVQPDRAYFGEKDAQQLAVIRRMIDDLNVPVCIVEVPTVREADGLAISSRNQHLTAEERRTAPVLYQALAKAQTLISAGANPAETRDAALAMLQQYPELRVEYLEIVDPDEMQPVGRITGPVRVAAALWLGKTRLIDNLLCRPPARTAENGAKS